MSERAERVKEIRERVDGLPRGPWDCRSTDMATGGRRVCREEMEGAPNDAVQGGGYERLVAIAIGDVGYPDSFGPSDQNGGWSVPYEPDAVATKEGVADFIAHAREDVPWLLAEIDRLREERERLRDKKTGTQLKGDFNYSVWEAECENGHKTYHEDDPDTAYCAKCGGMLNGVVRLVPDWEVWQAQLEAARQAPADSEESGDE